MLFNIIVYLQLRFSSKVRAYFFVKRVSLLLKNVLNPYRLLLQFKYQRDHSQLKIKIKIDSNLIFSAFLHNNLKEEQYATFWQIFFHESFKDILSDNLFERHLGIF